MNGLKQIKNYDRSWAKVIRVQSENGYSIRSIQFDGEASPPQVVLTWHSKHGGNMSRMSWRQNSGYRALRRNGKNTPLHPMQGNGSD